MALVIRTDFSDEHAWDSLCEAISAPVGKLGFLANVDFLDDARYLGIRTAQLLDRFAEGGEHTFVIVADSVTMSHPERPLLVIDLHSERGREFRAVPSAVQSIENNLSIANMDFDEFADAVDADGVFRGFPQP